MNWKKSLAVMSLMLAFGGCVFDNSGLRPPDGMVIQNNNVNNNTNVNNSNSNCIPTNGGVEICDSEDNNCDGNIDEGFDLTSDPNNCGFCGNNCTYFHANGTCVTGQCTLESCQAGWVNLNQNLGDGCEYQCSETNGGVEICDEQDNDCDGSIDEGFDLISDPNNCGFCGNVCSVAIPHATSECVSGQCEMLECWKTGNSHTWWDLNDDSSDGCEYQCQVSMGGHEVCDGLDNDCDGQIDEDCGSLKLLFQFGDALTTWPSYVADLSGNGNDGVAHGGASLACNTGDYVPGEDQDSCSVAFDGTGYIEVQNSASLNFSDNFTVMFWIWYEPQAVNSGIISHGRACATPRSWDIIGNDASQVFIKWSSDGNNTYNNYGFSGIGTYLWQHVVLTFENGVGRFYLNGNFISEINTHVGETVFVNTVNLYLGRNHCSSSDPNVSFFNGNLDEIAFYNNAWDVIEIQQYHNFFSP